MNRPKNGFREIAPVRLGHIRAASDVLVQPTTETAQLGRPKYAEIRVD